METYFYFFIFFSISAVNPLAAQYPLAVWWKGDDDLEFFTLRCRNEDQMRQWETTITRLIKEATQRRLAERSGSGLSRVVQANSTNPSPQARMITSHYSTTSSNPISTYSSSHTSQSSTIRSRPSYTGYDYDDQSTLASNTNSTYGSGPKGYPPHDGFDFEPDEDELEDYPSASIISPASGRGTPVGSRRTPNAFSMPIERDSSAGYDRTVRAQTEGNDGPNMAQWRTNGLPPLPSASVVSPNGHVRPAASRMPSNISSASYSSDGSFNNIPQRSASGRPPLRSQYSSSRLKSGYESPGSASGSTTSDYRKRAATPTLNVNNLPPPQAPPAITRSRSASQPSAYNPPQRAMPPPPLPTAMSQSQPHWSREHRIPNGVPTNVPMNGKRGSGSSQSTGESSDYSPNSSSPITPFGSSDSSLGGVAIRNSRSQAFDGGVNGHDHHPSSPPVKVKVHFHEDIFVIQVPRSTEYGDLVEKVGRKIRLCGPRREDGPLRVKYRDEDGDMVSLGSTEDVQMAFEQYRPGGQVTLFVT